MGVECVIEVFPVFSLCYAIHSGSLVRPQCSVADPQVVLITDVMVQAGKNQSRLPASLFAYPCQVSCHVLFVPCITFMFLLPRSIYRGGLRSARVSRFIARPLRHTAPHHLQRGHCPPSLSHWTTYSGTDLAVASPRALHVARPVNHLSLSGSMPSETPGCRLRACRTALAAWPAPRQTGSAPPKI